MTDFVWPTILVLNAILVILVGIIFIWKLHNNKKSGYPLNDERTLKISGRAAIGTYYITIAFMVSLILFTIIGNEFLNFPELEAGWAIIATLLVSGISNALLSWYYSKKGDL